MTVSAKGLFVVIDGPDATGKSTLVASLAAALRETGHATLATREPGGTPLGEGIRDLFLNPEEEINSQAELLLLLAARAQHVTDIIIPALERDLIVITDRFTPSSLAYQGVARGLGIRTVTQLANWATRGLTPDLTLILDASSRVTTERLRQRHTPTDRMEKDGREMQAEVRQAFRQLAKQHGWRRINTEDNPDAVLETAYEITTAILRRKRYYPPTTPRKQRQSPEHAQ